MIVLLFLCSVILLCLSSPSPGLSFCAWFSLVPLFFGCSFVRPKKAALLGFSCGLAYYAYLIYWVVISLGTYGNFPWWASGTSLLLLCAYMSIYPALFCALISWSQKKISLIWLAPFLWVALDYCRGWMFSGFPWQDLGYSQYNTPLLIQSSDLFGHHGITFSIVLTNSLLFCLLTPFSQKTSCRQKKNKTPLISAALILIFLAAYSFLAMGHMQTKTQKAQRLKVSVIQGNIDQNQKWKPEKKRQAIEKYVNLTKKATEEQDTSLVIWPETAMPFHPTGNQLFSELLNLTVFEGTYSLLSGSPYFKENSRETELYNSAILVRPDGTEALYFKQHLVPFGEYIPFADYLPLPGPVVESVGNFSAGNNAVPLQTGTAKLGILICFESIFPDIARKQVTNGANLLVNITNDAWFGRSSASLQHMSMAVFRAVENRRSLARSANSGISCFIDPIGRISQPTTLFTEEFINGSPTLHGHITFFNRFGYLFPLLCLLFSIALLAFLKTRQRN